MKLKRKIKFNPEWNSVYNKRKKSNINLKNFIDLMIVKRMIRVIKLIDKLKTQREWN